MKHPIKILLLASALLSVSLMMACKNTNTASCQPDAPNANGKNQAEKQAALPSEMSVTSEKESVVWADQLSEAQIQEETRKINDASLRLFRAMIQPEENLIISPYSIFSAFAISYVGARGETAKQMEKVFACNENTPKYISVMTEALEKRAKQNGMKLQIANSIWADSSEPFSSAFRNRVKNYFRGQAYPVDYLKNAAGAVEQINDWTAKQTNQKILSLLKNEDLTEGTKLVLVNTIYFSGEWLNVFDEQFTYHSEFSPTPDSPIKVRMMDQENHVPYFENEKLQILEMPYRNGEFSLLFLLPKEADGMREMIDSLTAHTLHDLCNQLKHQRVIMIIPKFKLDCKMKLKQCLIPLGMTDAFTVHADFSGMNGKRDLYLSLAIHQTSFKIDEQGTEATAVAGVSTKVYCRLPVFRANRPFLILLQDKQSKLILFAGLIVKPVS